MAGSTKIDGTIYAVSGGKTRVSGTIYDIAGGKTRINASIYDISFGPDPLQVYSVGDTDLKNGASIVTNNDSTFASDGIKMRSKYGSAIVHIGIKLPKDAMLRYRKLVFSLLYVDAGTPQDARVGWGNGNYAFNMAYYTPSSYANHGTTKYQEVSYIGATAEREFILDISEIAGIEEIQFGVKFQGSGVDGSRDKTYALIKDIHLE